SGSVRLRLRQEKEKKSCAKARMLKAADLARSSPPSRRTRAKPTAVAPAISRPWTSRARASRRGGARPRRGGGGGGAAGAPWGGARGGEGGGRRGVARLIQRIWIAVKGAGQPARAAPSMNRTSPVLHDSR